MKSSRGRNMKRLLKQLAHWLFGEYAIYHIHAVSPEQAVRTTAETTVFRFARLEQSQIESSADPLMREQIAYHGDAADAYGCLDGSRIVAICYFWHGAQYKKRNFWPLAEREAKLVQIITLPSLRGRGIAADLIRFAARDMFRAGYTRLYARIWHSNRPSLNSFDKANWERVATVVELWPCRAKQPWRLTLPRLRRSRAPGAAR